MTKSLMVVLSALLLVSIGCEGPAGPAGTAGTNGVDGTDGTDGLSCTVTDDGAGTKTLTCEDGTTATVTDGADGTAGTNGTNCTVADNGDGTKTISCDDGTSATVADGTVIDPADVDVESCATCHKGAGAGHQAVYDDYLDASNLVATIGAVVTTGTYDTTVTFTLTMNGLPYVDADGLPMLEQKRFMGLRFVGGLYADPISFGSPTNTGTPGEYTVSATGLAYDVTTEDAALYFYFADEELDGGKKGGHVHLYNDVASVAMTFNGWDAATAGNSMATVSGCEKCHGAPYGKHGYRMAAVAGLEDFDACRFCHYSTRSGGHEDWQVLVDNPLRYTQLGTTPLTPAEEAQYAYTANVMNDTHMSHAMEFPFPQSMSTCNTCHEGKLAAILAPANMTITTCKSCHPVTGSATYGTADLALDTILPAGAVHREPYGTACTNCHTGGAIPSFDEIHNGYDTKIYDAPDAKYADLFVADIAAVSVANNVMTIDITVTEDASSASTLNVGDVIPTVMVGLYGWDTKDFIVGPHERDANRNRLAEFAIDGVTTNPRFTVIDGDGTDGTWQVTFDMTDWATMLTDGTVKRAEVAVMPKLSRVVNDQDISVGTCDPACSRGSHCDATDTCVPDDDVILGLNAPSKTFDFASNAFDLNHFAPIVDAANCNTCHDQLATTFHSGDRGGNVVVCRMCHITKNGGSHLEMQSRSIDSYAHAIHSFQAFDSGDVDFTDPVEKMRYEHHIEHTYPAFTAMACETCHNPGTYDVPDQAKSMGGLLSSSDTWTTMEREIGDVPSVITGPGARACGGCHRAELINEDMANGLAAFNQHTASNGYRVEDTSLLEQIAAVIASIFE